MGDETDHFFLKQQQRFTLKAHQAKKLLLLRAEGRNWTTEDPSIEVAAGYLRVTPSLSNFASIGFEVSFWTIVSVLVCAWIALFMVIVTMPLRVFLAEFTFSASVASACHTC